MQPAKTTKYLCLFLCGICSDYTLRATWAAVLPPVAFEGRAFSGSAISESRISVKVLGKKTSRCRELFANQSQSNQPCSHCKFRIFCLLWLWACCFQFLCHFGKCKAKLNVAFQLSGMKSVFPAVGWLVELRQPEFDCAFCKVA